MQSEKTSQPTARPSRWRARLLLPAVVAGLCLAQGCASSSSSSSNSHLQSDYPTPEAAVDAFASALRANDTTSLEKVFGPEATDVLSSGDDVADQNTAQKFLQAYDEQHKLVSTSADSFVLEVGKDGWPLPIPIVRDSTTGGWWFDTEAGKDEILNRRIGTNELDVIQVCQAIVDAQQEYARLDPNGDGVPEYAAKFLSDAGTRNGLYYETKEGEAPSPLGNLVASAVEEGYGGSQRAAGEPTPYHGYCYRMLTSQGAGAEGGALDYIVKDRMIGGFAAVAYPAEYGDSGIMTFIVNHRGVVYQKDLGKDTAKLAKAIKAFDPSDGWKPVDAGAESTAVTPAAK